MQEGPRRAKQKQRPWNFVRRLRYLIALSFPESVYMCINDAAEIALP